MSAHIKAELFDLGPHNGMCEPDPKGSYHAFTLTEIGDKGDEPQWSSFMVPAHQLPVRADLCTTDERVKALEAENARLRAALYDIGKSAADRASAALRDTEGGENVS